MQQTSNVNVTDLNVFVVHETHFWGQLDKPIPIKITKDGRQKLKVHVLLNLFGHRPQSVYKGQGAWHSTNTTPSAGFTYRLARLKPRASTFRGPPAKAYNVF